jgi:hypothetical protein
VNIQYSVCHGAPIKEVHGLAFSLTSSYLFANLGDSSNGEAIIIKLCMFGITDPTLPVAIVLQAAYLLINFGPHLSNQIFMSTQFPHLLQGLREALRSVLRSDPDRRDINRLVSICHGLALSCLHIKRSHRLMLVEDSLNISDLGYDCIAELFQRDEAGDLVKIKTYFGSIDVDTSTDQELLVYLRRLVFSSVNQSLVRLYSNFDPNLGKILRNLKLSVQNLGTFTETDRLGEQCLAPQLCDPLLHLPVVNLDRLQAELSSRLRGVERIPEILSALSRYLREQTEHSRQVPITRLALAIRWVYALKQIPSDLTVQTEDSFAHQDILRLIQASCVEIRRDVADDYVIRGKVSPDTVEAYMEAIRRYLARKLDGGSTPLSLFASLQSVIPTLTRHGYAAKHRPRLEYLARKTEESTVQRLRKDMR